jgi:predicted enzyme related to lactoylglutathione lyase
MGQSVVHFEIGCRDSQKTQEFFAKLFGWQMEAAGPATALALLATLGAALATNALSARPMDYARSTASGSTSRTAPRAAPSNSWGPR